MYKYEEPKSFIMDDILNKYSQEDIFKIIFNEYPDFNINYLSPFRIDNNANCFFDWYKGKLYFKDYASDVRDCFQAIKDYFNLATYGEVLTFIDNYFQTNEITSKEKFQTIRQKHKDSSFYSITTIKRSFEFRDDLFWKQYFITENQLNEDLVFPVFRYRFYSRKISKWVSITPFDIAYAISDFEKSLKIYRPYSDNLKSKWLTNCSNNDIGNINNLNEKLPYLMITKSYKDFRVIKNEGYPNTVWFQSEKMYPYNKILLSLIKSYPYIFIFYDNDKTGIEGSEKLRNAILKLIPNKFVKLIYSPFPIFKDPAEIVSVKGKNSLQQLLWKNCQV